MKKISKYLASGLTILFFTLTIYIIIVTVGALVQKRDANILGFSISVVVTDSMVDTINVGDFIIYDHSEFDEIKVGDIVVFRYIGSNQTLQGEKIVHRVVGINENGTFETRGDKYNTSDTEELGEENYIGKVTFYTSFLGLGLLRVNSLNIFFGIVVLGFLVLIVIEIKNFATNYQKLLAEERKKKEDQYKK